jgi:phospholipid/cholesterol/gamma-HCH transport system substrate-binding protein
MAPSPVRDLIVGLFVLAGLGAIGYLTIQLGGVSYTGPGGFELYASFDEIGGLARRSPVRISGVKVGQVTRLDLDPSLELPVDSKAEIRTSGVLGDQFVALEPGAEDELLAPGEEFSFTQDAISIERLIGKFMGDELEDED